MQKQSSKKESSGQNTESQSTNDFKDGEAFSRDPYNHTKLKGGKAVTMLSSSWLYKKCDQCGHTFRMDDPVTISKEGVVRHNSALLQCSGSNIEYELTGLNTNDYYNGVMISYPPPKDLIVVIITEEDEIFKSLLAPPENGFKRNECTICGHTLRPNDIVVLCPCHPDNPLCRVTIHWDPFRGLNCWNEWKSNQDSLYCPATSEKIG